MKLAGVDHRETIDELSLLHYNEDEDRWNIVDSFKLAYMYIKEVKTF